MESGGYCQIKKNPTLKIERKLSQVLSKIKDLIPPAKCGELVQHYSKVTHLYGIPKIHKDGIPLSAIVSARGSAWHRSTRFLVNIITPLVGKPSSYVQNSAHFVEIINNAPIHPNQMIGLFTKAFTDEALTVIRKKLTSNTSSGGRTCIPINNTMETMSCVEITYFAMRSDIYRQEERLEMRSPLYPHTGQYIYMKPAM